MSAWPTPDKPVGRLELVLDTPSTLAADDDLRDGLSAVASDGEHLWLANDETTSLERLRKQSDKRFAHHESFDLTNVLHVPDGEGEIDIEGIDIDDGMLWLVGSHSAVRKRIKNDHSPAEAATALATVEVSPRRRVLARLSPKAHLEGEIDPTVRQAGPAVLGLGRTGDILELVSADPHLAGFLPASSEPAARPIPGKDNGVDFEGLAVTGSRVFIGLRGPVLRGWALILEVDVGDGVEFELQPIGPGGRRYRKHFVDMRGLGVRDLSRDDEDLLVLAGPTMDLDGRTAVFRWRNAFASDAEAVVTRDDLERVVEVPFGKGEDHAEGISILADDDNSLVVVYDSPADDRKDGEHGVFADVFRIDRP